MNPLFEKPPTGGAPCPILVTERDAARMLAISERLLWTLRDNGELPYVRLSKSAVRYRPADLEAFAAQRIATKKEA